MEYLEQTVDLSRDVTSHAEGMIRLRAVTPYLCAPIEYFAKRGKHIMTVQAVEQTAKSTLWKMGLMYRMKFLPGPAGIVYQNKEVGSSVIRDSFLPLLRCEPDFARYLPEREREAPKRLRLPGGVLYLMTGDSEIVSFPMSVMIGDEINKWRAERANRRKRKLKKDDDVTVSKVLDLDKRCRSFADSLRVLVCSPEGKKAPISAEYEKSSQGVYFLRCPKCGELSFDTTKPEECLHFEVENGSLVSGSCRLVCPKCGASFSEERKADLCCAGDYLHRFPERFEVHAGFSWGALAAQFPGVGWEVIARAIMGARGNSYEAKAFFYNSICGVPYSPAVLTHDALKLIDGHKAEIAAEELKARIAAVYLGVDTQEVGYWYAVNAVDHAGNFFTLDYGYSFDDDGIREAWNREYCGLQPFAAIIDEGGHRKGDVDLLVASMGAGVYKYKGESRRGGDRKPGHYRHSADDPLLLLCEARHYNREFLLKLHAPERSETGKWTILCEVKKTFLQQIASFQPPFGEPDAAFEDYTSENRQHDLFDAEKMTFALHDFAVAEFPAGFFRSTGGKAQSGTQYIVKS